LLSYIGVRRTLNPPLESQCKNYFSGRNFRFLALYAKILNIDHEVYGQECL